MHRLKPVQNLQADHKNVIHCHLCVFFKNLSEIGALNFDDYEISGWKVYLADQSWEVGLILQYLEHQAKLIEQLGSVLKNSNYNPFLFLRGWNCVPRLVECIICLHRP